MDEGVEFARAADGLEGRYSNFFQIGFTAFEFIIDFGQSYPDGHRERINTRVVTNPAYALELLNVLRNSIANYEQTYGAIPKP